MAIRKMFGRKSAAAAGALAGLLLLAFTGCKKSNNPADIATSVAITNLCGASVNIYMDGTFQFTIADGANNTAQNVSQGAHAFEAKKSDTGSLIYSATLNTVTGVSYALTIPGLASVLVTNRYGEMLKIFVNDAYIGDIGDQISQPVSRVKFGSYKYSASRKSDGVSVATTTIAVSEAKEYGWIITK